LRLTLTAAHTPADLAKLLAALPAVTRSTQHETIPHA